MDSFMAFDSSSGVSCYSNHGAPALAHVERVPSATPCESFESSRPSRCTKETRRKNAQVMNVVDLPWLRRDLSNDEFSRGLVSLAVLALFAMVSLSFEGYITESVAFNYIFQM